jgi:SAM-dependent methyltransferase
MCDSGGARALVERDLQGRRWTLARCRKCGLHFTDPLPSTDEILAFYEGDYHAELRTAGATEQKFGAKYERYADTLSRHLSSGRVVDVGCATGLLVRILSDRGYQAEGIELNSRSADWGRANYGVTIHTEPLECCPYEPESLDALLFTDVLEDTEHRRNYLREAARFLVLGRIVLITFPDIRSAESRYYNALSKLLRRDWLWTCGHFPRHIWDLTRPTAERCFASAGFRVLEFRRSQQSGEAPPDARIVRLLKLNSPPRPLRWRHIERWLGNQMEFVIQKTHQAPAPRRNMPRSRNGDQARAVAS